MHQHHSSHGIGNSHPPILWQVLFYSSFMHLKLTRLCSLPAEQIPVGVLAHAFWSGGGCLVLFLNGLIWRQDAINRAPAFCDFSTFRITAYSLPFNIYRVFYSHPDSYLLLCGNERRHPMLNALHFETVERLTEEARGL